MHRSILPFLLSYLLLLSGCGSNAFSSVAENSSWEKEASAASIPEESSQSKIPIESQPEATESASQGEIAVSEKLETDQEEVREPQERLTDYLAGDVLPVTFTTRRYENSGRIVGLGTDRTQEVSIRVEYPELSGLPDKTVEDKINSAILQSVTSTLDAYGEDLMMWHCSYEVTFVSTELLCIFFSGELVGSFLGREQPAYWAMNFKIKTGETVSVLDFFTISNSLYDKILVPENVVRWRDYSGEEAKEIACRSWEEPWYDSVDIRNQFTHETDLLRDEADYRHYCSFLRWEPEGKISLNLGHEVYIAGSRLVVLSAPLSELTEYYK